MNKLLIAIVLSGCGAAGPLAAAVAPPADRDAACGQQWRALPADDARRSAGERAFVHRCLADCPARSAGQDGRAYGARARDYCEVRWTDRLAAHEAGDRTHDEFIDLCLRRCVSARGATAGAPLGWILGGVGAAALAGGVAAGGEGSHPPPASP